MISTVTSTRGYGFIERYTMRLLYIFRAFLLNLWYAIKGLFTGDITTAQEIIEIQRMILEYSKREMRILEEENDRLRINDRKRALNEMFGTNRPPQD